MWVGIWSDLPHGLACCRINRVDMPATVAEEREIPLPDARHSYRVSHAGTRGVVPMIAAGLCVERIDLTALRSDIDAAAHDGGLTEDRDHAREAEGPFKLQPSELCRTDSRILLIAPILRITP